MEENLLKKGDGYVFIVFFRVGDFKWKDNC